MKKLLSALIFALSVTTSAYAHEGHDQRIMGVVSAIQKGQVQVKASNGKVSTVVLNEKTKVVMGKMAHTVADIKVGDRVVVTATDVKDKAGKTILVAKQVALAPVKAAAPTK